MVVAVNSDTRYLNIIGNVHIHSYVHRPYNKNENV